MNRFRIYILIGAIFFWVNSFADKKNYDMLMGLSSEELFSKGEYYNDHYADSALICYSVIESRYDASLPKEEKIMCVNALINKCRIFYYRYYDFASTYECLSKAKEIIEENSLKMPSVYLQMGVLYQSISDQSGDSQAALVAFDNYRKGYSDALDLGDTTVTDVLASNIVNLAYHIDSLEVITADWNRYEHLMASNPNPKYEYNIRMYEGMKYLHAGDYDRCMEIFDTLMTIPPADGTIIRYRIAAMLNKALAIKAKGNYNKEKQILIEALHIAEKNNMKDAMIEIFGMLATCCRNLDDSITSMIYENKSLRLNDSLVNYSQLSRLEEIKSGRSLRKYQSRLTEIEHHKNMQRVVIIITTFFLLIMGVLVFMLVKRNRRLQESNEMLYSKNMEWMRQNEEERTMRKEYERRIEDLQNKANNITTGQREKYKNSNLDNSQKAELAENIMRAMETNDEWQSPDFTIERLSEIMGAKSKQVSQVINEKWACNFNSFINEYRIREACKRITDIGHYGNLTLDAISKSVGFRARSSFFTAFKGVTGLTPSEFLKIARAQGKT